MTTVLGMMTLVPGGMGGSETYARELLREFGTRGTDVTAVLPSTAAGFAPEVAERVLPGRPLGESAAARSAGVLRGLLRPAAWRRQVADASLVHFPFTVPAPPAPRDTPWVVTVHDVQHHDLPSLFSLAQRAYRRIAYDAPARRADAVITVSRFAKERIVTRLGIEPSRVHVAAPGVRLPTEAPPVEREPFVLYPARGWPHKNHATLFAALPLLRSLRPDLRLVLTGATAHELGEVPADVDVRGRVPAAELLHLYRTAAVVVVPSRYEGFGFPALEAMAHGCPVAASTAGAIPEVVGDAAVPFAPLDAFGLAHAVDEAWARGEELAALGRARAARFSWSACAARHEEVYARCAR